MGWCIIQRWEDGCIQRERQDCWRFRRHGWAAQIWRRILAIKGKLVDKKVIFAIRVTTDFETFVLSPPLKKTILLIPTWRFYCLYVFLKINVGISRVFFSKGGERTNVPKSVINYLWAILVPGDEWLYVAGRWWALKEYNTLHVTDTSVSGCQ